MNTVRQRRLQADYERLSKLVSAHQSSLVIESARGNPPESYVVEFRGRSVAELREKAPVFCDRQRIKIEIPAEYPALPPLVTVFGAIFHPHVWPRNNVVCLGPWSITESLDNLVLRLHSLLRYDPAQLNWKNVANQEAAEWARRNQHLFPLGSTTPTGSPSPAQPIAHWHETA